MNTIEKLLVALGLDSKEFDKGIDDVEKRSSDAGSKIMSGLGGALGGLATAAVGAMATVTAALGTTIGPASDLEETISKTTVVFGDWSEDVIHWGQRAAEALGMSQNTAMGAASTYGNLFRAMGIGVETSADMSMNLVGLAADLASFNNMDPTQVLDALRSGLSGETEPLKRLGVNLNAAMVEAKALEMGLWDGNGALDAAAKAQATYALVMEQTSLAQGDFARTSDGLANQQRILDANLENIKATIGVGILPVVNQFTTGLNDMLSSIMGVISGTGTMDEKMSAVGGIVSEFVNGLAEGIPSILEMGSKIVISVTQGIIQMLPGLMPAAVQLLLTLINGVLTLLPMLLDAALQIVVQLALGIAEALPSLIPTIVEMMLMLVTVILQNIPMLIEAAIAIVLGLIEGIINALPMLIEQLPVIIETVVTVLMRSLPLLLEAGLKIILALIDGLIVALPQLVAAIPELIAAIVETLFTYLPVIIQAGADQVTGLIDGIKERLPALKDAGVQLMKGFWDGLKSMFNRIRESVSGFVDDMVGKIREILGIHSPSRVFYGIGENLMLGLANGIEQFGKKPLELTAQISGNIAERTKVSGVAAAGSQDGEEIAGMFETMGKYGGPSAAEIGRAVAFELIRAGALG